MKNLKFILPLVIDFITNLINSKSKFAGSSSFFSDTVQDKVLQGTIKFFFSVVLLSVIIFAIFVVGQQINGYLIATGNAHLMAMSLFVLISIGSVMGLVFLLKPKTKIKDQIEAKEAHKIKMQKLLLSLCERIVEGLQNRSINPSPSDSSIPKGENRPSEELISH